MKELREKKIPFTIRRYLPDQRCAGGAAAACACADTTGRASAQHAHTLALPLTGPRLPPRSYEDWKIDELIIPD